MYKIIQTKFLLAILALALSMVGTAVLAEVSYSQPCRVDFIGEVHEQSVLLLSDELRMKQAGCTQLSLFIESGGGDVGSGQFILKDLMEMNLHTHVRGEAGSMAVAIFMTGTKRTMDPNAELYLHELMTQQHQPWSVSELERELTRMIRLQEQYALFIAERSQGRVSQEAVISLMKKDGYVSASQALQMGLISEIEIN